jgi:hypothetical protein
MGILRVGYCVFANELTEMNCGTYNLLSDFKLLP